MKKIVKILSALSLVSISIAGLASCGKIESSTPTTGSEATGSSGTTGTTGTSGTTTSGASTTVPVDYVTYNVKTQSISGKPISNAYVTLKGRNGEYSGFSDSNGQASIKAPAGTYEVQCEDMESEGYVVDSSSDGIQIDDSGEEIIIKFKPQLIQEQMPENTKYAENDQAYDYTFEGYDFGSKTNFGEKVTWTLSDLLEDNELVVLNFWYTTCSWCVREFPFLVDSYSAYTDKVKVIGINPGESYNDTVDTVKTFASEQKLNIMSTVGDTSLIAPFGVTGFPTSVFIDRYGTITMIEGGAITTKDKWDGLFAKYTGDNYVPTYEASGSDVVPDVEFPGSAVLEKAALAKNVSATFKEEDRETYKNIWPWVATEDGTAIKPSNKGVNSSYSIAWMDITVPANKVLAIDYKASCEDGDMLGIFLDGKRLCQMSGNDKEFKTKYLYVAGNTDEKISVEFFFYKDSKTAMFDDTVYVNNVRFMEQSELTSKFQVIRQAASGEINPFTLKWSNYITPVFNENDGYYHVGSEDGPLLLAALNDSNTHFSNNSIVTFLAENPELFVDKTDPKNPIDYGKIISQYANYGDNSSITMLDLPTNGLTSITKDLAAALQFVARELGDEKLKDFDLQWLEMCVYISEYNTPKGEEIGDPIKGLATFNALEAQITNPEDSLDDHYNYIKFDFPLVPRGYLFKFTPEKSGIYHLYGISGQSTECFFYGTGSERQEDSRAYVSRDNFIRYDNNVKYAEDFDQYMYYEAGQTYYVAPVFFDIDDTEHLLRFRIDYYGTYKEYLAQASDGTFTYNENADGSIGNIISISNIKVALGNDGFYHPTDNNGNVINDEYIYADFKYTTGVFSSNSLEQIIEKGGFNFSKDENGNAVAGSDETSTIKQYLAQMDTDVNSVTYGTVKVNLGLMGLLQKLMDKYTFKDVADSWLKVCYFKVTLGSK